MLRWYQGVLARRPVLTQCITTGILMATGDTIAQQAIERKGKDHDFMRTTRMASYGTVIFGPAAANWYRLLSRHVVHRNKNVEIAARVFLDQAVFTPTFLGVFLVTMGYLDGHHDPVAHVRGHYWDLLKTNWMVWPGVQITNFKFVPLDHRLNFANFFAVGWNCYLSYVNSHTSEDRAAEEGVEKKGHLE